LRRAAAGSENLMPYLYEAVKAYATLGEITEAMRQVFGVYDEIAVT
jgi:methylmalonyl-CoA mutase N-terminal domain/subunit